MAYSSVHKLINESPGFACSLEAITFAQAQGTSPAQLCKAMKISKRTIAIFGEAPDLLFPSPSIFTLLTFFNKNKIHTAVCLDTLRKKKSDSKTSVTSTGIMKLNPENVLANISKGLTSKEVITNHGGVDLTIEARTLSAEQIQFFITCILENSNIEKIPYIFCDTGESKTGIYLYHFIRALTGCAHEHAINKLNEYSKSAAMSVTVYKTDPIKETQSWSCWRTPSTSQNVGSMGELSFGLRAALQRYANSGTCLSTCKVLTRIKQSSAQRLLQNEQIPAENLITEMQLIRTESRKHNRGEKSGQLYTLYLNCAIELGLNQATFLRNSAPPT
jgi:hypothetical protein